MSEKTRKKPVYSSEFKAEAVAKCLDIGVSATSKELGVSYVSLSNWVQRSGGQPSSPVAKPSYEDLEREVQRLRKEVGYVNEINRILKKSTAIFSAGEMVSLK